MTEAPKENGNGIQVPIPILGGKIAVKGAAAIIAVMLAGLGYWIYDQVKLRDAEMAAIRDQIRSVEKGRQAQLSLIACKIDLSIFLHTMPKGAVDWSLVPANMYECIPNLKMK